MAKTGNGKALYESSRIGGSRYSYLCFILLRAQRYLVIKSSEANGGFIVMAIEKDMVEMENRVHDEIRAPLVSRDGKNKENNFMGPT
ncbi:hypothetical protein L2E82_32056 [Cichorium intybus]|uniref:Uncharacterized protein n=1 Tax=Cichorium intybus TaxID=13427 RepID=A0ACB9BHM1_CICIN|nr:hypothetical protein L2E82_32056 [Cichorium intybus]